ncbi:MAG: hypothetical protein ABI851_13465 [Saprospiraceae bacterium]
MLNILNRTILVLFIAFLAACGDDSSSSVDCSGVVATYNTTVSNILNNSCAFSGCHESSTLAGNVDFSTYQTSSNYLKKASNQFLCSINHNAGCIEMPQGFPKLDTDLIKNLTCWYNNGFPQ